jgi:hypothetical protein
VISFSVGREDLSKCHLKVDQVEPRYRPLPRLLIDHLGQGVWRYCLFPGSKHGNQQLQACLDYVTEDMEEMFPGDDDQEDEPMDPAAFFATQLQQFSMKEIEHGEGKSAFESYLDAALSVRNDAILAHWGYTDME